MFMSHADNDSRLEANGRTGDIWSHGLNDKGHESTTRTVFPVHCFMKSVG